MQISIFDLRDKNKSREKSSSRTSENWLTKTSSPNAEIISFAISLHRARSGATIIAVVALSEAKDERIISSILLVFPTPVGNCTIAL